MGINVLKIITCFLLDVMAIILVLYAFRATAADKMTCSQKQKHQNAAGNVQTSMNKFNHCHYCSDPQGGAL